MPGDVAGTPWDLSLNAWRNPSKTGGPWLVENLPQFEAECVAMFPIDCTVLQPRKPAGSRNPVQLPRPSQSWWHRLLCG